MIDPRGPRFAAWITTLVLAAVLATGSAWLLVVQAAVFALGATGRNPYSLFWKHGFDAIGLKRTPPAELEDARPPKFAQLVGLGFAVAGLIGFATGVGALALGATAAAFAAAFLNAAFGICLGCEMYLVFKRTTTREGATV